MNIISKKVNAFTLIELIIAMIISGIVIAIASTGYLIVIRQFEDYRKNNRLIQEGFTLRWVMNNDFLNSNTVMVLDNQILKCNLSNQEIISYYFTPQSIVRQSSFSTDTFHIKVADREFMFQHNEAKVGLVDELNIVGKLFDEKIRFSVNKVYDAKALMDIN